MCIRDSEYIGEGNYSPDPDSGELMEGNDAGWTEQDGYFEPCLLYTSPLFYQPVKTAFCNQKAKKQSNWY